MSASFLVWAIFGGLFVGKLFAHDVSAQPIIYAVISLTLIRMVPVAIALVGTRLRPVTVAFMGWFGPRGLASVVFTLIALNDLEHSGAGNHLVQTATWTILLSVLRAGRVAGAAAAPDCAHLGQAGPAAVDRCSCRAGRPAPPAPRK